MQACWRWAIPFWLFRDANQGSKEQRIANYRYNRAQRDMLHAYTLKWMAIAGLMLLVTEAYSGALSTLQENSPAYYCAMLFCASSGIVFSIACTIIAVLMTCYLYLTYVKR